MARAVAAQQQISSASALSVVIRSSALCPPTFLRKPNKNATEQVTPIRLRLHRLEETHTNNPLLQPGTKSAHCAGAASGFFREESVPRTMKFRFSPTCPTPPILTPPYLSLHFALKALIR
ncbi:hypothetical protein E5288_WYG003351 [Bos mutus]|uniref:Uncharacterized protein n=1 Tax=Bos mutus TaxID=72004 RepID=A0A6B0RFE5_9CETA|nr:hypothetical protein [Bos mutus]